MENTGPIPDYLLLGSPAPITCLAFARFNFNDHDRFILSGDQDGNVSCWNLKYRRMVSTIKGAHEGSILSVSPISVGNKAQEAGAAVTHGRDGMVYRWKISDDGSQWAKDGQIVCCPTSFCPFSFILVEDIGLLAVPDSSESSQISVYNTNKTSLGPAIRLKHQKETSKKFGLLMDLVTSCSALDIFILGGFESGHIALWALHLSRVKSSFAHDDYTVISYEKFHREPIMSLDFSANTNLGYSASADGQLTSWSIVSENNERGHKFKFNLNISKKLDSGIGCLKCRHDGRLVLLGVWNKEVILLGGKKLKHLGRLDLHEEVVSCICFSEETKEFALGSKDKIISIWSLYASTN